MEGVGDGLAAGIELLAGTLETKSKLDQNDYNGAIEAFSKGVTNGVKSGLKLAKIDGEVLASGDEEKLMAGLEEALGELKKDGELLGNLEKVKDEKANALLTSIKDAVGNLDGNALSDNLAKAKKELEQQQKQAAIESMREEAKDALAEAQADADELSEAQRFGAEASSIDKLVAKLQRDRMVLQLATQISQGGASFLAKFVPALGAVAAGIKLAAQLHAAGLRAQQLYRWVQNQDDLEAAQSSLSSSAGNFVRNQKEQLAHYAAQAFFAAAQLAAEITKLTGVASLAGIGLDVAATAGAKVEELTRDWFRKEDLEKAWEVTAQALRNPTNRKLGLKARKLNPSLAKYAIAWGATELGDPLARNALRACNLTDASLNDKDTDVDKVVFYLETFYSDDLKLYRELDETPAWVPKDVTLSLSSWAQLKRSSIEKGKLQDIKTGKLDGQIAQLDSLAEGPAWEDFNKAQAVWKIAVKSFESASSAPPTKPKVDAPKVDNSVVLEAVARVESEVNVKTRLVGQVKESLKSFKEELKTSHNPDDANFKAMDRAVAVLIDQASVLSRSVEGEMQTVLILRSKFV